MNNCIFSAHCLEQMCDRSCPAFVETSYLLERNNITMNSSVFYESQNNIDKMNAVLDKSSESLGICIVSNPSDSNRFSDLLTYCAICRNWKGSQLHCNVYNLRYSKFLEATKQSWGKYRSDEDLEYMRIWSDYCKILVVSNIEYVNFGDFESQTLLNIIQSRLSGNKTTIIVSPPLQNLVSNKGSLFFNALKGRLSEAIRRMSE